MTIGVVFFLVGVIKIAKIDFQKDTSNKYFIACLE